MIGKTLLRFKRSEFIARWRGKPPISKSAASYMDVFNRNRTLSFHVFRENIVELMPVVYAPVIARARGLLRLPVLLGQ